MKNSELQKLLAQYPDDMPIKNLLDGYIVADFEKENIMLTSDTSYADENYPEEEWDCEDGKFCLGDGERYLLINPIIY